MISTQRVYILLALCVLFWSGNFIVGRYVNESIEAIELSFFRWLFTLIFLLPSLFYKYTKNQTGYKRKFQNTYSTFFFRYYFI
ncbi:MAG: EamA family transporter [Halarcobacter sp.]